jgi:hypothetical protein
VADDFDCILDQLGQYQLENPGARIRTINVLGHSPMLGRPAQHDKREFVIPAFPQRMA